MGIEQFIKDNLKLDKFHIKELNTGITNTAYKVDDLVNSKSYIVSKLRNDSRLLTQLSLQQEIKILDIIKLGNFNIPNYVYIDESYRVSEYLELENYDSDDYIDELCNLMSSFHKLSDKTSAISYNYINTTRPSLDSLFMIYNRLANSKDYRSIDFNRELDYIRRDYSELTNKEYLLRNIIHLDIYKDNILRSNSKFYLIDFEYVIVSTKLIDYASFIYDMEFSIENQKYIKWMIFNNEAREFYRSLDEFERDIDLSKYYLRIFWRLGSLYRSSNSENYEYNLNLLEDDIRMYRRLRND